MAGTRMRRSTKRTAAAIAATAQPPVSAELHGCDATALTLVGGDAHAAIAQEEPLEEIDTEEDDSEFDERAHWGRRRVKSKASGDGAKKKKAPVEDKLQPKINLFCVQKPPREETKRAEEECAAAQDESTDNAAKETEDAVTVVEEDDDGNGGSSVEVLVKAAIGDGPPGPSSPLISTVSAEPASATAPAAATPDAALMSPATTMQSGRPKRQSVLRAEQAQLQSSQESLFMTPPTHPPTKKSAVNTATLDGEETEKKATASSGSLSSRKRKLEMAADKKKPAQQTTFTPKTASPVPLVAASKTAEVKPAKSAAKVFFLTEEQKKQVIEIEAVTLLKEQLRQQRERDLAFFGGREVQNPFFQSRSQKVIDVDAPEVIELVDTPESSPTPRKSKSRWSKEPEEFPKLQHVLQTPTQRKEADAVLLKLPTRKSAEADVVVLDDDDDECMDEGRPYTASSSSPDAADAQVPRDDLFWLLSSSMQTTSSIDEEIVLMSLSGDLSVDVMIDKISEVYGIKEKRVRKTLRALELAREKRQDKALNLSLVDRYLPVQSHGMIGNTDTLKKLSAWLSAWKSGRGGDRDRNFDDALFAFEGDDSDDSDDDGTQLYRLFVLKGDVGSGKSAAVYACAEEFGYEIIEINAGQLRTGKAVVDIAGEATQSTRVLHGGGPVVSDNKSKMKRSSSKKRRKDGEPTKPSHLSLVLFEDVDLVFDEDKGFLSTLGSIAKHSKCPIVVTCRTLPSGFPSAPPAISESLRRPSTREFVAWLSLVAYLEAIPLTHLLASRLSELFDCDVRRSLNFLQTYREDIDRQVTYRLHDYHDILAWTSSSTSTPLSDTAIAIVVDSQEAAGERRRPVPVPAWSRHKLRSFDLLTSNFLPLLKGTLCDAAPQTSGNKENDTRPHEQKQRDVQALDDLWGVQDAISFTEDWEASFRIAHRRDDASDYFFQAEALEELTADVRSLSLSSFMRRNRRASDGSETMAAPLMLDTCPLGDGVERALRAAREHDARTQKATRLATLKTKLELPLVAKGSGSVDWRFSGDYMPMVARLLESSEPMQESRGGRRRTSRRNHYLSEILTDMAVVDDIREFQDYSRYLMGATHDDEIVASSPLASPDPSPTKLPLDTSVAV